MLAFGAPLVKPERHREGFSYVWNGIFGETPDAVPLIEPIDGSNGQWICAEVWTVKDLNLPQMRYGAWPPDNNLLYRLKAPNTSLVLFCLLKFSIA